MPIFPTRIRSSNASAIGAKSQNRPVNYDSVQLTRPSRRSVRRNEISASVGWQGPRLADASRPKITVERQPKQFREGKAEAHEFRAGGIPQVNMKAMLHINGIAPISLGSVAEGHRHPFPSSKEKFFAVLDDGINSTVRNRLNEFA
ncbi:hypothetical protein [Sphingobium sp. AntQ-1]|uniref:hypothetical protein n=1 Tax=Sphingobium sp. AntQ-1 TaxID=2930091 RepID=UPI00234E501D|nr:hypothetical protein [Sphingobium sp. AntQ-1]